MIRRIVKHKKTAEKFTAEKGEEDEKREREKSIEFRLSDRVCTGVCPDACGAGTEQEHYSGIYFDSPCERSGILVLS